MQRIILLALASWAWFCTPTSAQNRETDDTLQVAVFVKVNRTWYDGDSIPNLRLHEFYRYSPLVFKSMKERERYNRMVKNIKYLYPMAQLVRTTLIETHDYLQTLPTKKAKDEHIAKVEKGVKEQYTPLVRKLSRSQGKLLIKLIDRECGQTSYEMVKAFLGPVRASFYQVVAGIFGANMNKHYDPEGDDKYTERIVRMVESGQL